MPIPTRPDAIRALEDGWRDVSDLLANLSEEDLVRSATIGDGDWSAKDLLGHLATWEALALRALNEWRAGTKPSVETDVFEHPGGVDAVNAESVAEKREWPLERVRSDAEDTHRRLVAEIDNMSESEWRSKAAYPTERRTRLVSLLGSITGKRGGPFQHASAHLPDLDAFVRSVTP